MIISKYQLLDFISTLIESSIGYYLYKDNKKKLTISLLKDIKVGSIILDILLMLSCSALSIFIMITMYLFSVKLFVVLICLSILCISCFNPYYIILLVFISYYRIQDDTRVLSTVYAKFRTLLCYSIYNLISLFLSVTVLELVLHINYQGFKMGIFLLMNLFMIFNITKKISVNTTLLLFRSRERYIDNLCTRIKAIGNVCMSSITKLFSFIYIHPLDEDYIVLYSLLHNCSYYESVKEIRKIRIRHKLRSRFLLYPYAIVMVYFINHYVRLRFFGDYQKILFFLDIHIFFIEVYHSISAYYNLIDSELEIKP